MNAGCIWRSISIQYVQIKPGVNSDLGNGSFWVEIRDAKHLITSRCTCRSTQVKIYAGFIASTYLWPQEMFTFLEVLALVESESSFGAYVCHMHRRPAGLHATSALVFKHQFWDLSSIIFNFHPSSFPTSCHWSWMARADGEQRSHEGGRSCALRDHGGSGLRMHDCVHVILQLGVAVLSILFPSVFPSHAPFHFNGLYTHFYAKSPL